MSSGGPRTTPDREPPAFLKEVLLPANNRLAPNPHITQAWKKDVLGPEFLAVTLDLGTDDEGPVVATLVKYHPPRTRRTARAILYVHGWSDYFFQEETAQFWHAQGATFYAIDLRKYGRSLRDYQSPGYVDDLAIYSQDIEAGIDLILEELGPNTSIMLMGHSTGGLTTSLWAHYNPGRISGLILNSPWLELQGSSALRTISAPAISQLARFQPKTPLPNIDPGFYARSVDKVYGGEWTMDPKWRPNPAFPVRAGWLAAVITGHAKVARGLEIEVPILTLASAKTSIAPRWSEEMRTSDSVLDVDLITKRAVQLGSNVTVVRIKDGIHDLALSARPARAQYYKRIGQWLTAYGWAGPA